MNKLHTMSASERKPFIEAAAFQSGIPASVIEKDFWVVWILEKMFSLDELKQHLTFKGGTSLSKIYRIIHRFSEDIDLSVEKTFFGFDGEKDPEKAESKSKQKALIRELSQRCRKYVQGSLKDSLSKVIRVDLKDGQWNLRLDPEDPDGQTLLFDYPRGEDEKNYISPFVRIEMGARAEHWPVSDHFVQSYLKETLIEQIDEAPVKVKVLNAERTFWEKATILHMYCHLPESKKVPARMSRHFYDFFCLLNSDIKTRSLKNADLLQRVATHKGIYFSSGWASYETAAKGNLKLLPTARVLNELKEDYELMNIMFLKDAPQWDEMLGAIRTFEKEFNL